MNTSIGDNPYISYTPSLVNCAFTIKGRIMSKTFDEADTKHEGTSSPIVSVRGSSPEKSGVMFDLTPQSAGICQRVVGRGSTQVEGDSDGHRRQRGNAP